MRVLVTGHAGFIGFHTAKRLLERGDSVVGFDNVNDYYDPALKRARLGVLDRVAADRGAPYRFHEADLADRAAVERCFAEGPFDRVIHLAAQAGVRYSLENPHAYVESNLIGFANILEACRHAAAPHLVYASTSSVYGANSRLPFSEHDGADHPLQFYAATKRANELMAHSYSHLFRLPTTGLRFFTVYGPWGRPDMALFQFTRNIIAGRPIKLFNHGRHVRDFTYIDDLVDGVVRVSDDIAKPDPQWDSADPDPATSNAPFRILNIGNSSPVQLMDYVEAIEDAVGKKAIREFLPDQPGELHHTYADVTSLMRAVDYRPRTPVREGGGALRGVVSGPHGEPITGAAGVRRATEALRLPARRAPDAGIDEAQRLHVLPPIDISQVDDHRLPHFPLQALEIERAELDPFRHDHKRVGIARAGIGILCIGDLGQFAPGLVHARRVEGTDRRAHVGEADDERNRGSLAHVVGVRLERQPEHGDLPAADLAAKRVGNLAGHGALAIVVDGDHGIDDA